MSDYTVRPTFENVQIKHADVLVGTDYEQQIVLVHYNTLVQVMHYIKCMLVT